MMAEPAKKPHKLPLKRPLFNKPAWSRPQKVASPTRFFHRSSSSYIDLAAEAERKRRAKLARKQAAAVKDDQEALAHRQNKARSVLSDSDGESEKASGQSDSEMRAESLKDETPHWHQDDTGGLTVAPTSAKAAEDSTPKSLSNRYEDGVNLNKVEERPTLSSNIIELDDSSNEEVVPDKADHSAPAQTKTSLAPDEDEFTASDDEYAELARKARQKARRKRLEDEIVSSTHEQSPSVEPDGQSQRPLCVQQSTPPPPPDPEVYILITSSLENTTPLIIKRKLSQRLKDVRVAWCQHQKLTAEMSKTVFLTWRGKRLFDVTSCKSLGIIVDDDGNVSTKGQVRLFGQEEQKIHMEAMTEELFEERKKAKNRKAEAKQEDIYEEEVELPQKPEELQTRIILKAKGFDDFKLLVKTVS